MALISIDPGNRCFNGFDLPLDAGLYTLQLSIPGGGGLASQFPIRHDDLGELVEQRFCYQGPWDLRLQKQLHHLPDRVAGQIALRVVHQLGERKVAVSGRIEFFHRSRITKSRHELQALKFL